MGVQDYASAGVKGQGEALGSVMRHLGPTLNLPDDAQLLTDFGGYASVIKVADDLAIAFSTDGVGSKTLIAAALDRYDTIGFDCVAMNVNDVLCVGARPVAMVDYLGVHTLSEARTDQILQGLGAAAKEAGIAIPGGELAQLPEIIGAAGDDTAFDLVGACIGLVHPDRLVLGSAVRVGDAIIGLASSGIHSNGLTLARRVLLEGAGYRLEQPVESLGRTLGDELLEPTRIYVDAVRTLWDAGVETRGLAHITSDGFANLCRLAAPVGYRIERLPQTPAIFELIGSARKLDDAELFRVFNMGVGFVVIVAEDEVERTANLLAGRGFGATHIGTVTDREGVVEIEPVRLIGGLRAGESRFEPV